MTPRKYIVDRTFDLCRSNKNLFFYVLEIGTANAFRAVSVLKSAQSAGQWLLHYYGVDLFDAYYKVPDREVLHEIEGFGVPPPMVEDALRWIGSRLNVPQSKPVPHVELQVGYSRNVLPAMAVGLHPPDLVLWNGGCSTDTVAEDWKWIRKVSRKGTTVIAGHYFPDNEEMGSFSLIEDEANLEGWDVFFLPIFWNDPYLKVRTQMVEMVSRG